jgi:hypothetical protein
MINIVFVHLGEKTPKILLANLNRCKELFPRNQISVIGDSPGLLTAVGKYCDSTYLFEPEIDLKLILNQNNYDRNFRDGFWLKTTMRLFAVTKYVQEQKIDNCLHLESDVLLSSDFPFQKFESLHKLSWSKFNGNHDVAAIFFVPNPRLAEVFDKNLGKILLENQNLTDMTALSRMGVEFPELITYLPSAESEDSELFTGRNVSEIDRKLMSENSSYFGGIFDAAPIGMWTLGQDPRNHRGVLKRNISLPESFINPSTVECDVTFDSKMVARPKSNRSQVIPLFSLHVHSKNDKVLNVGSLKSLKMYLSTSANNEKLRKFYILVFFQCVLRGTKRRLLRFIK